MATMANGRVSPAVRHWGTLHSNSSCHDLGVPGRVAQSVTCLATDASLIADPGVASSIPNRSHTFVEIDYDHSPPFR